MHMIEMLKKRREDGEEGFTLIELMVVVLIIAILIAIAIPTFLGAQDRARDRAVQSNLRNGITAAKTIATDSDGFFFTSGTAVINATALTGVEGALTFVDGAAPATPVKGTVYVPTVPADGTSIVLQSKSGSGTFFCMKATSGGAVTYGKGDSGATDGSAATECAATKF